MKTNNDYIKIENKICSFLNEHFEIDATNSTTLLGKNSNITSLSVMKLVAWCEDTFCIEDLLKDDLFLKSLSSVSSLANVIFSKGSRV